MLSKKDLAKIKSEILENLRVQAESHSRAEWYLEQPVTALGYCEAAKKELETAQRLQNRFEGFQLLLGALGKPGFAEEIRDTWNKQREVFRQGLREIKKKKEVI